MLTSGSPLTNSAFLHCPRLFARLFIAARPAFTKCFEMREAFVKFLARIVELIDQLSSVVVHDSLQGLRANSAVLSSPNEFLQCLSRPTSSAVHREIQNRPI